MKVALCSAVWGRFDLTALWWRAVSRVRMQLRDADIQSDAIVAGSEDSHEELSYQAGGYWVYSENERLGQKWNDVVNAALRDGADYIFILGSDDFFGPGLIKQYISSIQRGVRYVGMSGLYFYEPTTNRTLLLQADQWGNYPSAPDACRVQRLKHKRKQTFFGAGRLLHRSFFEGHEQFWKPDICHGLDANMARNLNLPPADELIFTSPEAVLVDVKTRENIWSFDKLAAVYPFCLQPDASALASLPELSLIRSTLAGETG